LILEKAHLGSFPDPAQYNIVHAFSVKRSSLLPNNPSSRHHIIGWRLPVFLAIGFPFAFIRGPLQYCLMNPLHTISLLPWFFLKKPHFSSNSQS